VIFYVGVPDVEAALHRAESLGGQRQIVPVLAPTGLVVVKGATNRSAASFRPARLTHSRRKMLTPA